MFLFINATNNLNKMETDLSNFWYNKKKTKYGKDIIAERTNFFFLKDGSMVYDYEKFDSYIDAMIDAVKNHGEDLDDLISLVFQEKVDQPIVKKKMLKLMEEQS